MHYSVLIIDDEKELSEYTAKYFNMSGVPAQYALDSASALEFFKDNTCSLILLDINLPNNNGETLLQDFRKVSSTPVIMLTSRASEIDEVLSMSFGADDYVTKPYNPTILLLRISAVLKRSSKVSTVQMYHDTEVSTVKGSLVRDDKEQILTKNEMIIFQLQFYQY